MAARHSHLRQRIAQEAARLMAEEGISDFQLAKRKAATHIGAEDLRSMPLNQEVEAALADYQRLFDPGSHDHLRSLREAAISAMRLLADFNPRLVGPVLRGTAHRHSSVNLHVFAGTAKDVALYLLARAIPFDTGQRRLRFGAELSADYPVFRFLAGEHSIEVTAFPLDGPPQPPLSPVDGKPMRRAPLTVVQALLDHDEQAQILAGS
jgi:hypothetical protein